MAFCAFSRVRLFVDPFPVVVVRFIGSPAFWQRVSARLPFPFFLIEGWGRVTLIPKKASQVAWPGLRPHQ